MPPRPLLSLVMIVRNEEDAIAAALASAFPAVDRFDILDTGSTDATVDLIGASGLPGTLHRGPFVDFSQARNLALELAAPEARWCLMLSGGETMHDAGGLRAFLEGAEQEAHDAYDLQVQLGRARYAHPRLTRSGSAWRYQGPTHEALEHPRGVIPGPAPVGPWILHQRSAAKQAAQRERWLLDVELLSAALERNPQDTRAAFYLAQSYELLGRRSVAIAAYEDRIRMGGWVEEQFEARLRRAQLLADAGQWERGYADFLRAAALAPHRAEPHYHLARRLRQRGASGAAYAHAHLAAHLPYPLRNRLFVDAEVYAWRALAELARAAYQAGRRDEAAAVARQAIERGAVGAEAEELEALHS